MVTFVHLHSSIHTFFEQAGHKIFLMLLGYIVAKACASPRNSTWFTRPFLLMRGWGLGARLSLAHQPSIISVQTISDLDSSKILCLSYDNIRSSTSFHHFFIQVTSWEDLPIDPQVKNVSLLLINVQSIICYKKK